MRLDELRTIIASSAPSDWHRITNLGPTYRDRFGAWTGPNDSSGLEHDTHSEIAVYRPDIDLTIAYGMSESQRDQSLAFEWSESFPDSQIREISLADFFWRGSLVDRVNYVYVDGARAILPLGSGHQGLKITRYDLAVAGLLDRVSGHDEFDRYFSLVPYELQD
ncbi:hypothetical protein [Nocardia sp. NPDC003979]